MADGNLAAARTSGGAGGVAGRPPDMTGLVRIDLATGRAKTRSSVWKQAKASARRPTPAGGESHGAAGCRPGEAEASHRRHRPAEAYRLLGRIYAVQHRLDEATAQFRQLVERNPKSVAANTMLGMLFEAKRQLPEAAQQYQHTLSLDGRAPVAANNLAWLFVTTNRNLDQALQFAQTAQQQFPAEPHFNDTLGWIYYRKNLMSFAVRHLELSVKANPNDPDSHYHLGMAYLKSGDGVRAKKELQHALTLKPDFDGADEARKALVAI